MGFTPAIYEVIHSVKEVVDPGTTPRKYDPEKAKALMAEAGHPTVECTLSYDTNRTDPNLPDAVQANLAAVGITVTLNGMNTGAFSAISTKVPQGNDMIFQGLRGAAPERSARGDRDVRQGDHLLPGLLTPGGVLHPHGEGTAATRTIAEANADIAQMEKIAYDDARVIGITMAAFISVTGPNLKNMEWHLGNTPTPWFNEAWLVK